MVCAECEAKISSESVSQVLIDFSRRLFTIDQESPDLLARIDDIGNSPNYCNELLDGPGAVIEDARREGHRLRPALSLGHAHALRPGPLSLVSPSGRFPLVVSRPGSSWHHHQRSSPAPWSSVASR